MVKEDQNLIGATDTYRSENRDDAQRRISSLFSPHELVPAEGGSQLNVRLSAARLKNLTIAQLGHGPEVIIRTGRLGYFQVNLPISGTTISKSGKETIYSGPELGVVLDPAERSEMRWSEGCEQLCIKISREAIEQHLSQALGHRLDAPLHFDPGMRTSDNPVRAWRRTLRILLDDLREDPDILHQPLILSNFENLLMVQLLHAQSNNYSASLRDGTLEVRPRTVKRVIDLVQEAPEEQYSAANLAQAAGVSLRTLEDSFKVHLGTTPMAYLRDIRLARAHEDLLRTNAEDGTNVKDIAYKWGFSHVPRFAAAYRNRYGLSPSETLRNRKPA
ncbi:AraC family transcriptional regulator [Pseudarthrobacter sp. S9]|uniref:AraC family transcriptional regulator n=1 Tax=Pseudarthrobacter sp. S9 TaxID=3418421 RepID=UPI003CFC9EC6